MNVMEPTHPDWIAFCDALAGEEYCNIKKGSLVMRCQPDYGYTRSLLAKKWPEIDVEATLKFFQGHAAMCDCEVLFNVEDGMSVMNVMGPDHPD